MAALEAAPSASLDALLAARRVWRGQPAALPPARQSTGLAVLDDALPTHGWPDAALSELLLPADGMGELRLLLPTLARLTQSGQDIVLVAPPYLPYPVGWQQASVEFAHVHLVDASPRDALWVAEQCLRSGCLAAVLCWPRQADDRALRRLQVACESGQALGFALRDARQARNPSPAALRVLFERGEAGVQLRVLKCRGGNAPTHAIALDAPAPGQVVSNHPEANAYRPSLPSPAMPAGTPRPAALRDATHFLVPGGHAPGDAMAAMDAARVSVQGKEVLRFLPRSARPFPIGLRPAKHDVLSFPPPRGEKVAEEACA